MKKFLAAALSLTLALLTLASCSAPTTPPADDTTPAPEVGGTTPPAEDTTPAQTTPTDTTAEQTTPPETQEPDMPQNKQLRILFIGNSLTYYNDMPELLMKLGRAAGKDIYTERATVGSSTMAQQISSTTEIGKLVDKALAKSWDYVVIQPSRRITSKENTVLNAELAASHVLDQRIKAAGAQTVIYCTWGNNTGNTSVYKMNADGINASKGVTFNISRADHSAYMQTVSKQFAAELNAPLVDCAALFEYMATDHRAINMYYTDERHPSLFGSFGVACAFYAHFYNESPVAAATAYHNGIDSDVAILLAEAADHIVRGSQAPKPLEGNAGGQVAVIPGIEAVKWDGSGSENDPYIVASAGNFMYMVQLSASGESFKGKYVKQTADLDFKGGELTPVGASTPFSGTYIGGGHALSYYSVTGTTNSGTFAQTDGATISGLRFANATFKGSYVGAVAGAAHKTLITDCLLEASSSVEGSDRVGGIAGSTTETTIRSCVNRASVTGNDAGKHVYSGGIVGVAADASLVELCLNEGDIIAYNKTASRNGCAGGIMGSSGTSAGGEGNITRCVNRGTVSFTYDGTALSRGYVGGILGRAGNSKSPSYLTYCYNLGTLRNESKNTKYTAGTGQMCGVYDNVNVTLEQCFGLDTVSQQLTDTYGPDKRYSNYVAGKEGSNYSDAQYFRLSDTLGLKTQAQLDPLVSEITSQITVLK